MDTIKYRQLSRCNEEPGETTTFYSSQSLIQLEYQREQLRLSQKEEIESPLSDEQVKEIMQIIESIRCNRS
ncbi:MAG: hypothetical protein RR651_10765 [Lysinibacillus sp.]